MKNFALFVVITLFCTTADISFGQDGSYDPMKSVLDLLNKMDKDDVKMKKSSAEYHMKVVACANGNDNACISVNFDPNDACRRYFGTNDFRACLEWQCNNGNQMECQQIQAINRRLDAYTRSEAARLDAQSRASRIDSQRGYQNCMKACSFALPEDRASCHRDCDHSR